MRVMILSALIGFIGVRVGATTVDVQVAKSVVFCELSLSRLNLALTGEQLLFSDTKEGVDDDHFKTEFIVNSPFDVSALTFVADKSGEKYCVIVTKR